MYVLPYGQMSLWGELFCLKCNLFMIKYYLFSDWLNKDILMSVGLVRIKALKRFEVHNFEILSILYGGLLGDAHAERRNNGAGTRFSFQQESTHLTYLIWLHTKISSLGYCNPKLPEVHTRLGTGGKVRKYARFHTWTYSNLNWIREEWYKDNIKKVPLSLKELFNPVSLSIWIMDDGGKVSKGLKLATNNFKYEDCLFLATLLWNQFKLKSSVQSTGTPNQYCIYIWKESMPLLRDIVKNYIVPSMKYKIED